MKKFIFLLFLGSIFLISCQTKAQTGALAGGAIGAGTGAAISGSTGAIIGGAVGAVSGGIIGASLDEQDRQIMERTSPRTVERMDQGEPLTIGDIIKLSQGGISDDTIIKYIEKSKTTYNLSLFNNLLFYCRSLFPEIL